MRKTRRKPDSGARADAGVARRNAGSGRKDRVGQRRRRRAAIQAPSKSTSNGGALVATLRPAARAKSHQPCDGARLIDLAETVEDDDAILALAITGAGLDLLRGFRRRRRSAAGRNARAALQADRRDYQRRRHRRRSRTRDGARLARRRRHGAPRAHATRARQTAAFRRHPAPAAAGRRRPGSAHDS